MAQVPAPTAPSPYPGATPPPRPYWSPFPQAPRHGCHGRAPAASGRRAPAASGSKCRAGSDKGGEGGARRRRRRRGGANPGAGLAGAGVRRGVAARRGAPPLRPPRRPLPGPLRRRPRPLRPLPRFFLYKILRQVTVKRKAWQNH